MKKNSVKLSIITPVYGGAKFLEKLTTVAQKQNLRPDEYEVLFVDDFSKDNSREVIKSLSERFENVRYFFNEKNCRIATTRNNGLRNAKGEYIWYVDQDDLIEEGSGIMLMDICFANTLDILLFNYSQIDTFDKVISHPLVFKKSEVMSGRDFLHQYFENAIVTYLMGYPFRAIFRRRFLLDNQITFPDEIMPDDTTFLFRALYAASRVKSIEDSCYQYRVNPISYTHSQKASLINELYLCVADEEMQVVRQIEPEDATFADQIKNDAKRTVNLYLNRIAMQNIKERRKGWKYLKDCQYDTIVPMFDIKMNLCRVPILGYVFFMGYCALFQLYNRCRHDKP